jgi:hypothetical protein
VAPSRLRPTGGRSTARRSSPTATSSSAGTRRSSTGATRAVTARSRQVAEGRVSAANDGR